MSDEMNVGEKVNWLYQARGGYGYIIAVAGVVTKVGPTKVQIRVAKRDGDDWHAQTKWVQADRLTPRETLSEAEHLLTRDQPEAAVEQRRVEEQELDRMRQNTISRSGPYLNPID